MIANKLNVLLAERQLTIKDVVDGTNISRGTISNLINKNMNSNVNMDTLNKLCIFLKIKPHDFFSYAPYDLKFYLNDPEKSEYRNSYIENPVFITQKITNNSIDSFEDFVYLDDFDESPLYREVENNNCHVLTVGSRSRTTKKLESEINEIYEDVPVVFRKQISENAKKYLEKFVLKYYKEMFENSSDETIFYFEFSFGYTKKTLKELKKEYE